MTDVREIKTGDQVKIKGEEGWFTVTKVIVEKIKTIHKGELIFQRLYFGMTEHRPVWDYEVEDVRSGED